MMKRKLHTLCRRCLALACALAVSSIGLTANADETVENLQQQTNNLQQQLDSLNNDLTSLSSDISSLASEIEETDAAVQKAELDLIAAKLNEQLQYDAMKKRIKFMYETGNTSLLELILTSKSMGDFLNNTEFVKNVTEYDRNMLQEMQDIHNDIAAKDQSLKEQQASLQTMKSDLDTKQTELTGKISEASSDLQASSDALAQAQAAQEAAAQAEKQANAGGGQADESEQTSGGSGTSNAPAFDAPTDDMVLLAAILQAEAGTTDYDGLLAVATVIMNRVESGRYPNTISGVVYQSGQFYPAGSGTLTKILAQGPASLCYTVAQDALGGARLSAVSGCYQFRASWTGHAGINVGGNVFF